MGRHSRLIFGSPETRRRRRALRRRYDEAEAADVLAEPGVGIYVIGIAAAVGAAAAGLVAHFTGTPFSWTLMTASAVVTIEVGIYGLRHRLPVRRLPRLLLQLNVAGALLVALVWVVERMARGDLLGG